MKLLRIDSSARLTSVTRKLTAQFTKTWKKENPGGQVKERDLATTVLPLITDEWVEGSSVDPAQRTAAHQTAIAASDTLIAELVEADTIVIGAPMYNFSIPFPLKAWIDQIVRRSQTFSYGPEGPKGLLKDKKVFVVTSRAGAYGPGSPMQRADFQEPYLRFILGFIGITDVTFIHAESQGREEGGVSLAAAARKIEQSAGHASQL
jgi:FMN-dependent NADH-azoreductase